MRDVDMMGVLMDWPADMTKKQREFAADMAGLLAKGRTLTPAQSQYLEGIYNAIIAFRFGLEPMASNREHAAKRAASSRARAAGGAGTKRVYKF